MLNDWLWACLITLRMWLEVGGWARLLSRTLFRPAGRRTLGCRLGYGMAFGLTAQFYFGLSLLGQGSPGPGLHVALMIIGMLLYALPQSRATAASKAAPKASGEASGPRLHLKLARYFS